MDSAEILLPCANDAILCTVLNSHIPLVEDLHPIESFLEGYTLLQDVMIYTCMSTTPWMMILSAAVAQSRHQPSLVVH